LKMGTLEEGSYAYLTYDGHPLVHERLLGAWVNQSEYVVVTPDLDFFIEHIDSQNVDLSSLRLGNRAGDLPYGLAGMRLYRFAQRPVGQDLTNILRECALMARSERAARGLGGAVVAAAVGIAGAVAPAAVPNPLPPAPVPLPAAVAAGAAGAGAVVPAAAVQPAVPARRAAAGGEWVLDEPVGTFKVGQTVPLPAGAVEVGGRCFVTIDSKTVSLSFVPADTDLDAWTRRRLDALLLDDGRLIPKLVDADSTTLADVEKLMGEQVGPLYPLKGLPTVGDSMRGVIQKGTGGFPAAHDRWTVESRIDPHHRSVCEHKTLCRAIQFQRKNLVLFMVSLLIFFCDDSQ